LRLPDPDPDRSTDHCRTMRLALEGGGDFRAALLKNSGTKHDQEP